MLARWLQVLLLTTSIVGCATEAQVQAERISANTYTAADRARACFEEAYNSPGNAPVRPHVPLDWSKATLEQQADTNKATESEINAAFATHALVQKCRQIYNDQITQTSPSLVPVVVGVTTKNDEHLVALVQKKITWGEYVTRVRATLNEGRLAYDAEMQRIGAGLQQSHEAELARRQAVLNAMARYAQTQQMIEAMSRERVTTCSGFGNSVRCTTN